MPYVLIRHFNLKYRLSVIQRQTHCPLSVGLGIPISNDQSTAQAAENWLEVVLEQPSVPQGNISVDVLTNSLDALRKLLHLLCEAYVSERTLPMGESKTLRTKFEGMYELTCSQTQLGSYVVPISLDCKQETDLFLELEDYDRQKLAQLKQFTEETLGIVARADTTKFQQQFPENANAQRVLSSIKALSRSSSCTVKLRKATATQIIFDSNRDKSNLSKLYEHLKRESSSRHESREFTVVAEVEAVDLTTESVRLRTQEGLVFESKLSENFPEARQLFEPKLIEVDGTFEVDEDERVQSVVSEKQKRFVNVEPIEIREFQAENERLRADPPLKYKVEFFKSDDCYILEGDLDLNLYAFSREELESMVLDVLQSWWFEYVLADESELAPSGLQKKLEIMQRIKRV